MMAYIIAAEVLAAQDTFFMNYPKTFSAGILEKEIFSDARIFGYGLCRIDL